MMHPEVSVVLKDIENIMLLIRQTQITEITAESYELNMKTRSSKPHSNPRLPDSFWKPGGSTIK